MNRDLHFKALFNSLDDIPVKHPDDGFVLKLEKLAIQTMAKCKIVLLKQLLRLAAVLLILLSANIFSYKYMNGGDVIKNKSAMNVFDDNSYFLPVKDIYNE